MDFQVLLLLAVVGVVLALQFTENTFRPPLFVIPVAVLLLLRRLYNKRRLPVGGNVFITGCDSGMGEVTAVHLAKLGFKVFAGIYLEASAEKLKNQNSAIVPVKIDVSKEESVKAAAETVKQQVGDAGVIAVVNCAGIGYMGPTEFFPVKYFKEVLDVNLVGYFCVTQHFLPLVRQATQDPKSRRGRIVYIGTGGGVPSPSPPMLAAYMASKWGVDAMCQSLKLELKLAKRRIDCCVINPGFTKPTGLYAAGKAFIQRNWANMPPEAETVYKKLVETFVESAEAQPATHVSEVAKAIESALLDANPPLRYKVGFDSKASPIVGLLPTEVREWLLTKTLFAKALN